MKRCLWSCKDKLQACLKESRGNGLLDSGFKSIKRGSRVYYQSKNCKAVQMDDSLGVICKITHFYHYCSNFINFQKLNCVYINILEPNQMIRKIFLTTSQIAKKRQTWLVSPLNASYFTTLYHRFKQYQPNQQVYKSTSLKFQNQGLKMLAYQFSPNIFEDSSLDFNKQRHIMSGKIVTLSFLTEAGEGMEDDAWKNRKTIYLNLKECMQLFKIDSLKEQKVNIQQATLGQVQQGSENYSFYIDIIHNKEKREVGIQITHSKIRNQIKTHVWDMSFLLSFNEFKVLCQWIRSGIYYTSGAAFMIEYSKQHMLLQHSTEGSYNYSKKTPASTGQKNKK